MSYGKYLYEGGFIQKIAPGTTVILSKQANRRQKVIQPAKITKDNSRSFQKTPRRSLGQTATKTGPRPAGLLQSLFALHRPVCVSKIYTVNLRQFIVGASNGDRGN